MLSPTDIIKQINTILRELIQCSLAVDNNFPSSRMTTDNIQSIDFGKQETFEVGRMRELYTFHNDLFNDLDRILFSQIH